MSDLLTSYGISSYISQNILILPFQADFFREVMQALKQDVLRELHANPNVCGIILDVSKTKLIDLSNMHELESILKMASVLGVEAYICGLRPDVTLALVNLGYDNNQLKTCLNIEQGMSRIHNNISGNSQGSAYDCTKN